MKARTRRDELISERNEIVERITARLRMKLGARSLAEGSDGPSEDTDPQDSPFKRKAAHPRGEVPLQKRVDAFIEDIKREIISAGLGVTRHSGEKKGIDGTVTRVLVKKGQEVDKDTPIVVVKEPAGEVTLTPSQIEKDQIAPPGP